MRSSLSGKLIAVFSAILISVTALNVLICAFSLEKVYRSRKITQMRDFYSTIRQCYEDDASKDEIIETVKDLISYENIRVYIWDDNGKLIVDSLPLLLANDYEEPTEPPDGRPPMRGAWNGGGRRGRSELYIFAVPVPPEDVIFKGENYTIIEYSDFDDLGQECFYLRGELPKGRRMLVRRPVAPMSEAVTISNTLLLIVGISILVIGIFIVSVTSRTIARPVKELSNIAGAMEKLDFSKKYTGKRTDEIGKLGESINSLSEKLEATIDELYEKNKELKEDNELKTKIDTLRKEFIANASHELKTPIALISGYAEGLRDSVVTDEQSRVMYADVIIDESEKMDKIVRQMLDLMELDGTDEILSGCTFDMAHIAEEAVNSCGLLAKNKNVTIRCKCDEDCMVYGDYPRIYQAAINYITNAINHVDEKKEIDVFVENMGDAVCFSVYNSGENIPEGSLERIWERFYKIDKARTREYGGTGLGLSIVRSVIQMHGGKCGVKNLSGGVKFYFIINKENNNEA